jgi:hypothetical protein
VLPQAARTPVASASPAATPTNLAVLDLTAAPRAPVADFSADNVV